MTQKTWTFELDGRQHKVELDHGDWSGKHHLVLDGRSQELKQRMVGFSNEYRFKCEGRDCVVTAKPNWLTLGATFNFDLYVDGRSLATGKPFLPALPLPKWAWLFIITCVFIPVVAMGGAAPVLLGAVGTVGCVAIARHPGWGTGLRVALCAALALACWAVIVVLVIAAMAAGV